MDAVIAERMAAAGQFLKEYGELCRKYSMRVTSCGCCGDHIQFTDTEWMEDRLKDLEKYGIDASGMADQNR